MNIEDNEETFTKEIEKTEMEEEEEETKEKKEEE